MSDDEAMNVYFKMLAEDHENKDQILRNEYGIFNYETNII
jgi:hypothetical protein